VTVACIGHKRDSWFAIDSVTGTKVQTLSVDSAPEVCPSDSINHMFIGRTGSPIIGFTHCSTRVSRTYLSTVSYYSLLSGITRVSRYQKDTTSLDFTEASYSISWAICKSAPRFRQITTPAPHYLL